MTCSDLDCKRLLCFGQRLNSMLHFCPDTKRKEALVAVFFELLIQNSFDLE